MKQTYLNIFYHLGKGIADLEKLEPGMEIHQALFAVSNCYGWLFNFCSETEGIDIPESRAAAQNLMAAMDLLGNFRTRSSDRIDSPVTNQEVTLITGRKNWFEQCFEREYRYLDVFTVTPKGIYDTRLLISKPEEKFPIRVRAMLPQQTLDDLKQAALCFAFDIPTACAFHICRATEALMLAYYEVLAGHRWNLKKRDWNSYIDHLKKEGAPETITNRLDEIRKTDRNVYTHPERNVTLEEVPIQFELCTGVIFQMASEMDRKVQ